MALRDIIRHLKAGRHPSTLESAREICEGCCKKVYVVDEYVVKTNTVPANSCADYNKLAGKTYTIPVRKFRQMGLCRPRQWYVGDWVIQPYYPELEDYTPFNQMYREKMGGFPLAWKTRKFLQSNFYLDLHSGNVRQNRYGQIVAIDW